MSPADIRVRRAANDADRADAMRIRLAVFVGEQDVPPELEPDEYDAVAIHLVALAPGADTVVGTARVIDKGGGIAKIGRVAVLASHRGLGVGAALMRAALVAAQEQGATIAALDAQVAVIPFYERLGFVAEGPVFDDAGIPHRHMRRTLS
jgi:predicted GNAT family N-acyltransferase